MKLGSLVAICYGVWLVAGLVWLLPLKIALVRRVGNVTNDQLVSLAKRGDAEAQRLRRRTWWFIGVGLALLLPLSILNSMATV